MQKQWNLLADRLGTLVLSVVLALIIWLIASNQQNPIIQQTFEETLTVRGLTGSVAPLDDLSDIPIQVTVRVPENSIEAFRNSDFAAYIDLADLEPGSHDVPVQPSGVVDPQVKIVSFQPPELHIDLDEVITKALTFEPTITGKPADNYIALDAITEPFTVTISGPATWVDEVTSATTIIELNDAKSQLVVEEAPIELLNARGEAVSQVNADPEAVEKVVVPIEQRAGRKEVAVRPVLDGEPAAGRRLSSVRVTPSTVVLEGEGDVLAQVPGFVETVNLSLEGATENIEERIELVLPEGVTVQGGNSVIITAGVTPIEVGATLRVKPLIQELGPGLEASVALDTVEVIVRGPQPDLESMDPDDTFVFLGLSGLLPGSHAVEPTVLLPPGINQEGLFPEVVEVIIVSTEAETPAPVTVTATVTGTVSPKLESKNTPVSTSQP